MIKAKKPRGHFIESKVAPGVIRTAKGQEQLYTPALQLS